MRVCTIAAAAAAAVCLSSPLARWGLISKVEHISQELQAPPFKKAAARRHVGRDTRPPTSLLLPILILFPRPASQNNLLRGFSLCRW